MNPRRTLNRRQFLAQGATGLALGGCVAQPRGSKGSTGIPTVQPTSAQIAKFSDGTAEAGLSFIQSHGGCGLYYFVEQIGAGAAFLDCNGDGNLDIYFPQPKPLGKCKSRFKEPLRHRLYLNDGKGHFTLSPNAFGGVETDYGIAAAIGDYNNDGHPDIYVACYGRNTLFRNRGDGTFQDVTEQAGVGLHGFSSGAVWFDYDNDGFLDLFVIRYCEWSVETNIICRAANGKVDICHPSNYAPSTNVLYHNNRDGTFTDVTHKAGIGGERRRSLGAAAVDFDGDGRLDLFVANDLGPNFLYHNKGDGIFEDVAMQESTALGSSGLAQANMGVAVGDYNTDGRLDVLVTTFSDEPYTLYRNDGGFFTDVSNETGVGPATLPNLGFGAGFVDTRNSGLLDLFFANGHVFPAVEARNPGHTYKQHNQLLLNTGTNRFIDTSNVLPANDVRVHRGACFGDINNDGRIDILVTANNDRPTLLRNESSAGNWLLLKLTTAHGCCTAIGTRCTALVNGHKLLRVVLGGGSYGGESDHRVHFGLGSATIVEHLEIRWLSGMIQILKDIAANQILHVHEAPGGHTSKR